MRKENDLKKLISFHLSLAFPNQGGSSLEICESDDFVAELAELDQYIIGLVDSDQLRSRDLQLIESSKLKLKGLSLPMDEEAWRIQSMAYLESLLAVAKESLNSRNR